MGIIFVMDRESPSPTFTDKFGSRSNLREYVPTRIYSAVTRITPPQSRSIEAKMGGTRVYPDPATIRSLEFILHSPNYPDYLLPKTIHPKTTGSEADLTI